MSDNDPGRQNGHFDSVGCPRCNAVTGSPCINADGLPRKVAHASRGLEWVRQAEEGSAGVRTHESHDNGPGPDPS